MGNVSSTNPLRLYDPPKASCGSIGNLALCIFGHGFTVDCIASDRQLSSPIADMRDAGILALHGDGALVVMHSLYLIDPGPRPCWGEVVEHTFGANCDTDTDGNADSLSDTRWTELTVILRPAYVDRVDVDPLDELQPLVLVVKSDRYELAERTARFLQNRSGGLLSAQIPRERGNGG